MWRFAAVLVLIGCGGTVTEGTDAAVTPLDTACREQPECLEFCPPGQECDYVVNCHGGADGVGYCSLRCNSDENRAACESWGGYCADPGVGAEWCWR